MYRLVLCQMLNVLANTYSLCQKCNFNISTFFNEPNLYDSRNAVMLLNSAEGSEMLIRRIKFSFQTAN